MKAKMTLAVIGVSLAGFAMAQQPLDTASLDDTEVNRASCAAVRWHADMLAKYPRAAEACHEVIMSGSERWARFETVFQNVNNDGSVDSNFRDRNGRNMGSATIMPAYGQTVAIDGRDYRFAELRRGQVLNVYVPEGMYAFAMQPGAPTEQRAQIVRFSPDTVPAQTTAATTTRMTASRLPATAGPLPFIAIGGLLALMGGLGMSIRRRLG